MQSKATTVEQYLAELPEDRRAAIQAVREVIRANLDPDITERMSYGMIGYAVPHSVYPAGYHCDPSMPLPYAGLASQKAHMSLYLMSVYLGDGCEAQDGEAGGELSRWFREAWTATGRKLDMGRSCIRFKKLEDVPLEIIGEVIRRVPARAHIEQYETLLSRQRSGSGGAKARPAKKAPAMKAAAKPAKKAAKKKTTAKPAKKAARNAPSRAPRKAGTKRTAAKPRSR